MSGRIVGVTVTVVVLAAGALALRPGGWLRPEKEAALEGVPVRRGPMRIREIVSGNLAAKNSLSLRCELEGRTTVLSLVAEGTLVEAGDLVCELDTSELTDRLVVQKISEQNSAADFTKAREQFEIQKIQNTSDIAEAELMLLFARLDLEKYTIEDGEWTHEQKKAEEAIKLKEEEQKRAEAQLEMPGVFKNAIDWLSRPPADIPSVFGGRAVGVIGASPSRFGTLLSQTAWLPVLKTLGTAAYFGGRLQVSQAADAFDAQGALVDTRVREQLKKFLAGFCEFVATRR
jgi:multidrug efflux pump subunit AcrA (membrane-fusion protein)